MVVSIALGCIGFNNANKPFHSNPWKSDYYELISKLAIIPSHLINSSELTIVKNSKWKEMD